MERGGEESPADASAMNPEEPTLKPSSESRRENPLLETPQSRSDPRGDPPEAMPSLDRREIFRALEIVERDSIAIAESFASLFSSLRLALSEHSVCGTHLFQESVELCKVTSTSVENMQCFNDIIGSIQESALDAATKGNRYINSCLRLNEELKGMESLAMQLKILRKNVDALDLSVNRLLRLP